jgi:hypothetical protein
VSADHRESVAASTLTAARTAYQKATNTPAPVPAPQPVAVAATPTPVSDPAGGATSSLPTMPIQTQAPIPSTVAVPDKTVPTPASVQEMPTTAVPTPTAAPTAATASETPTGAPAVASVAHLAGVGSTSGHGSRSGLYAGLVVLALIVAGAAAAAVRRLRSPRSLRGSRVGAAEAGVGLFGPGAVTSLAVAVRDTRGKLLLTHDGEGWTLPAADVTDTSESSLLSAAAEVIGFTTGWPVPESSQLDAKLAGVVGDTAILEVHVPAEQPSAGAAQWATLSETADAIPGSDEWRTLLTP